MLKSRGARAERFLVAGASLMLAQSLITVLTAVIATWLHTGREMTNVQAAFWLSIFGLIRGVISLAGIICLVYAFWVKFKSGK